MMVLGVYYTEINSTASAKTRGEYYTPPGVSEVMARMLFGVGETNSGLDKAIEEWRPITISDPACGSGGMILTVAKQFAEKKAVDLLRATLVDVNPTACHMAYINTTLWGIPAKIIHGNSLTLETVRGWKKLPTG